MPLQWPVSLAGTIGATGFEDTLPDMVLASQPDNGPAKVRRRFTAAVRPWALRLSPLTAAQAADLDAFYTTTTAGGALPFELTHPRLGLRTVQFKPKSPPRMVPLGTGAWWSADLALEILP